jgi:hypothetical protein
VKKPDVFRQLNKEVLMLTETHQESSRTLVAQSKEAERKARAKLANPDVGSPEQGESTTDDKPPG